MTLREMLDATGHTVTKRLDQVLDSEDAIVILVDGAGVTTFYHGFGASGCQLELAAARVDAALRDVVGNGTRPKPGTACVEEPALAG
jgi:hypothetical protein